MEEKNAFREFLTVSRTWGLPALFIFCCCSVYGEVSKTSCDESTMPGPDEMCEVLEKLEGDMWADCRVDYDSKESDGYKRCNERRMVVRHLRYDTGCERKAVAMEDGIAMKIVGDESNFTKLRWNEVCIAYAGNKP